MDEAEAGDDKERSKATATGRALSPAGMSEAASVSLSSEAAASRLMLTACICATRLRCGEAGGQQGGA